MANWLGELVAKEVRPGDTVLDLGCGNLQATGRLTECHLAVDAFRPYLDHVRGRVPTLQGELPDILGSFPDKSYDIVLLLDVLEHLEAEHHAAVIEGVERVARARVCIFSPDGMMEQRAFDAFGLGFNALLEHRSAVAAQAFRDRGYDVSMWTTHNQQGITSSAFYAVKRF